MNLREEDQVFIIKEPQGIFLTALKEEKEAYCSLDFLDNSAKVGDIYLARVLRTDKKRAWLDVGENKPALCIPRSAFVEGERQVVRILKESITTTYSQKGALVTDKFPEKEHFLKETESREPPHRLFANDPLWKTYLKNLNAQPQITVNDYTLYQEITALGFVSITLKSDLGWPTPLKEVWQTMLEPVVPLPGGGWILFEEGETLTAIDINTSRYDQKSVELKGDHDLYEFNRRAGEICIEQIKLRNYGGRVVIDFPAFKNKGFYFKLWKDLKEKFREKETFIPGFTRTGLFELTRYRAGLSNPQKLKKINFI